MITLCQIYNQVPDNYGGHSKIPFIFTISTDTHTYHSTARMGTVGSAPTNFRWGGYKCTLGCNIMYLYDTWCCRLYNLVSGKLLN